MHLENKTVLITGASSGIGLATAKQCAAAGANLMLLARRKEKLEALAKALQVEYPITVTTVVCDLMQTVSIEAAVAQCLDQPIDVLINNAGLALGLESIAGGDSAQWDAMIDTNIKGLLKITQLLLPGMIERKSGHVVNLGSIAGHESYANGVVYCATKFAVGAISSGLRKELHGKNIRVTLISPGAVNTEFSQVRFSGDEARADKVYQGFEPLVANDIAEAILFSITRPPHVNIDEMLIMPTAQSSATSIARQ